MIKEFNLRLLPEQAENKEKLHEILLSQIPKHSRLNDYRIIKRSIDARKRPVKENLLIRVAIDDDKTITPIEQSYKFEPVGEGARKLIIVGAGPAGLFAAIEAIKNGIKPIVLERGCDVDKRRLDIANISRDSKINPQSNYCFGEGGAGAYSDGKLYTRSKKRGNVEEVLQLLVQHGAKADILIDAHPHIGSDVLPKVIKNIRETIIENGGEVRFETLVTGLLIENNKVIGVTTDHDPVYGDGIILAIGHSAHDTFRQLHSQSLLMESKGIAIGVRLEHPQTLIDRIQYHNPKGRGKWLPAAEYNFVTQVDGRGVYSFCMCPGGVIVPAGSNRDELVVNGMSASSRNGRFANSGMVVELHPGDIEGFENYGALEMLELQEALEHKFYEASEDQTLTAPAQRMTDFCAGKISSNLPKTSYAPGLVSKDLNTLLPSFIASRLAKGFIEFGRKANGFMTPEGVMIGLESRTSSPIRILRNSDTLASIDYPNLYPAGEGAGYAGGIVSAAIDGIRCVREFTKTINSPQQEI